MRHIVAKLLIVSRVSKADHRNKSVTKNLNKFLKVIVNGA